MDELDDMTHWGEPVADVPSDAFLKRRPVREVGLGRPLQNSRHGWRITDMTVAEIGQPRQPHPRTRSTAFSAIIIVAAAVLLDTISGMMEASATRKPSTP